MKTHADKIRENKNQSVVNTVSQKQGGCESTFQLVNNRPEATAHRKLQEMANNSPQILQLRAFQSMANSHAAQQKKAIQEKENKIEILKNIKPTQLKVHTDTEPIQLARIPVGYDRVSAATNPATDSLVTFGLMNCIAVAAQDRNTGFAVMGHLNTAPIWKNKGAFVAFRSLLINELQRVVGRVPQPSFHVSMGKVWMSSTRVEDVDHKSNEKWWDMRFWLFEVCASVFGNSPTGIGGVAEFNLAEGKIRGSGSLGEEMNQVAPSVNDPHGRAGDEIDYDRLKRKNVRGHKLTKNMTLADKLSVSMRPDG